MITAQRYHDISCGHRVHGHESKCANLHGHNYRVHFNVEAPALDSLGRVMDFSVIKEKLCMWLEDNWDHRFLIWKDDPLHSYLVDIDATVIVTDFNPTAENMALYILNVMAPSQLADTGCRLLSVKVEETRKCSVIANL